MWTSGDQCPHVLLMGTGSPLHHLTLHRSPPSLGFFVCDMGLKTAPPHRLTAVTRAQSLPRGPGGPGNRGVTSPLRHFYCRWPLPDRKVMSQAVGGPEGTKISSTREESIPFSWEQGAYFDPAFLSAQAWSPRGHGRRKKSVTSSQPGLLCHSFPSWFF